MMSFIRVLTMRWNDVRTEFNNFEIESKLSFHSVESCDFVNFQKHLIRLILACWKVYIYES